VGINKKSRLAVVAAGLGAVLFLGASASGATAVTTAAPALPPNSVTGPVQIKDGTVWQSDLAPAFVKALYGVYNNTVTTPSIVKGAVTEDKLSADVQKKLNAVGTGAQGPKGDTGAAGADGAQGPKGDTGAAGADGAQGPKGDTGPAGADGKDGAQGPKGDTGDSYLTGAYYAVAYYDKGDTNAGAIATVACKAEADTAISGGAQVLGLDATANARNTPVSSSFPGRMDWTTNAPKPGRLDGWVVQFGGGATAPEKVKVWALCVPGLTLPVVQTYQQSQG
jgi:hypothetical protein